MSPYHSGCFDARKKQRFQEAINECSIENLAAIRIDPNLYIERIIASLKSYDWYIQNPAVRVVRNLGTEGIGRLNVKWQFLLGNNLLQTADGAERGAIALLNRDMVWPPDFLNGVITECFINEQNMIRFKKSRLRSALTLVTKMDSSTGIRMLAAITERLRSGKVKPLVQTSERDETVAILQTFSVENPDYTPVITDLVVRLNSLEFPNPLADF